MSVLFLARDIDGARIVLKMVPPGIATNSARVRLMREARALAVVDHPGVVRVRSTGEHEDMPWIAMDYVNGIDLKRVIADRGPMRPEAAIGYTIQAAEALVAAHRAGVVHRDLKPSNLLLTAEGRVVLVDFGIAKRRADVRDGDVLTSAREVIGTPAYLSPEQNRARTGRRTQRCLGPRLRALRDGRRGSTLRSRGVGHHRGDPSRRADVPPARSERRLRHRLCVSAQELLCSDRFCPRPPAAPAQRARPARISLAGGRSPLVLFDACVDATLRPTERPAELLGRPVASAVDPSASPVVHPAGARAFDSAASPAVNPASRVVNPASPVFDPSASPAIDPAPSGVVVPPSAHVRGASGAVGGASLVGLDSRGRGSRPDQGHRGARRVAVVRRIVRRRAARARPRPRLSRAALAAASRRSSLRDHGVGLVRHGADGRAPRSARSRRVPGGFARVRVAARRRRGARQRQRRLPRSLPPHRFAAASRGQRSACLGNVRRRGHADRSHPGPGAFEGRVRGWSHHHGTVCQMLRPFTEQLLRSIGYSACVVERTQCVDHGDGQCLFQGNWLP